ncbi:uncharacterized protein M421DRAFT_343712 [Didymella exigua CBS 183.55]|uniref:Uncharacterized protein n=1 Tax=Didymella exigua CBS 183.55 TaxID=1150837 RepID=A0A6A5RYD0_9PLEO|nr:uncharacterized protein M421DRAFT_343712 [Didymella exigua CBS 183.55]KAF1931306.1 hypothetical protein M421DRAFT_343712 [Didymella exigua CBS 183.55]
MLRWMWQPSSSHFPKSIGEDEAGDWGETSRSLCKKISAQLLLNPVTPIACPADMATLHSLLSSLSTAPPPAVVVTSGSSDQKKASSKRVEDARPPNLLWHYNALRCTSAANRYIKQHGTQLDALSSTEPEPTIEIHNEADAVAHGRTNLVNPVSRAVQLKHPGEPVIRAEVGLSDLRVNMAVVSRRTQYRCAGRV